jgi:hypothetical protein
VDTSRTTTWDDPRDVARDVSELPGLEFLQRLIDEGRRVPIGVTLGFRLVEVGEGVAVFEAEAGPWAFNPIGSVHGGWYSMRRWDARCTPPCRPASPTPRWRSRRMSFEPFSPTRAFSEPRARSFIEGGPPR